MRPSDNKKEELKTHIHPVTFCGTWGKADASHRSLEFFSSIADIVTKLSGLIWTGYSPACEAAARELRVDLFGRSPGALGDRSAAAADLRAARGDKRAEVAARLSESLARR